MREAQRVGVVPTRFSRTPKKTQLARKLRRQETNVERELWRKLRNGQIQGVSFRRQHPAGAYILDFYAPSIGLAIELDGGQHSHNEHQTQDAARDQWLKAQGITVLRFWNSDATGNLPGVLAIIAAAISEIESSQSTPTRRWRADLPLSGRG